MNIARLVHAAGGAFALALVLAPPASAQQAPGQLRSLVFLEGIAQRGAACGLLRPWQGAALSAQVADAARAWSEEHRAQLRAQAEERAAATGCADEAMNVWITGATRGFEGELLAHYIIAYRALAQMSPPPPQFLAASGIENRDAALAAIAAKLEALEASGAVPEGGGPWPDFIARTSQGVVEMARALMSAQDPRRASRAQAEAWIIDSARITELWLADETR